MDGTSDGRAQKEREAQSRTDDRHARDLFGRFVGGLESMEGLQAHMGGVFHTGMNSKRCSLATRVQ